MTVHVLGVICPLDQRLNRGNHIHTVDVGGSTIRRVDPELVGCLVDVNATELSTTLSSSVCARVCVPGNLEQAHVCRRWGVRARARACGNRLFMPLEANEQQCRVQCHVLRVHVRTVRDSYEYQNTCRSESRNNDVDVGTFRVECTKGAGKKLQRCWEFLPGKGKQQLPKSSYFIEGKEEGYC